MWCRWTSEYLWALREWHQLKYGNGESSLAVRDVVIIKSLERNHNCWPLGIIEELIIGQDQVVRGAKLRVGKLVFERPVQHLYPLEFRPRRDAAAVAYLHTQDTIRLDNGQWENLNKLNFEHLFHFVTENIDFD